MIGWNTKYPYVNDEILNLDWVINKVKQLDQDMTELEARVLAAALAATKEYVDEEMASIRSDFDDLSREVGELRNYFDERVADLQGDYDRFINAVRIQLDLMTARINQLEANIRASIEGVNALTDLKIEQNNEYILERVAEGIVNVKVLNYFTGDYVTIQQMLDYLSQFHLDDPITYTELASANIDYDSLAALGINYTQLATSGKSYILP